MIEIREDGAVLVHCHNAAQTMAWVELLAPGEDARAAALLTAEDLAEVEAVWTPEVVAAWAAANPDYEPEPLPEPEPPTTEERLAAAESALLELMMGGL